MAPYARISRHRLGPKLFVTGYRIAWTGAGIVANLIGVLAGHLAPGLG